MPTKKEEAGICNQLYGNRGSLALATTNATTLLGADESIGTVDKAKLCRLDERGWRR